MPLNVNSQDPSFTEAVQLWRAGYIPTGKECELESRGEQERIWKSREVWLCVLSMAYAELEVYRRLRDMDKPKEGQHE